MLPHIFVGHLDFFFDNLLGFIYFSTGLSLSDWYGIVLLYVLNLLSVKIKNTGTHNF